MVRGPGVVSRDARARARQGARPLLRREPAPACRVLRRPRWTCPSALARGAAAREGALVQQPQRPLLGAPALPRVRSPGLRHRQAREPMRRRARSHDRGGVRQGARVRPRVGVRRHRRRQPRRRRRPGREARPAVRRGAVRAGLRRRRARGAAAAAGDARARRPRAAAAACAAARAEARARRRARPGRRRRDR